LQKNCNQTLVVMINIHYYLDTRKPNKEGRFPLKIVVAKNATNAMKSTGVYLLPSEWQNEKIVNHANKNLSRIMAAKLGEMQKAILDGMYSGIFVKKTAKQVLTMIDGHQDRLPVSSTQKGEFVTFFEKFIACKHNEGTRQLYVDTLKKINVFCYANGIDFNGLSFSDITKQWLSNFEAYCLTTQRQNSASRHLRDIRAVFNSAIDEERTIHYPFRKYKIKVAESRDKSFTSAKLRELFSYKPCTGGEKEAIDMFKLMFCLIGINSVDLANLIEMKNGRIEYYRRKTGKLYSIKVEKEAMDIIKTYKGKKHLLSILDRCSSYKTYFNRMGKTLRKCGLVRDSGKKNTGKPILPDVCLGAARTSWATIAQEELGIDRDVIAAALGHSTVDVTSTYLRTNWKAKVDDANRRVIDRVFNNQ